MKPRIGKTEGIASAKKFTYQSFSQKIASIKIDPVRKVRRYVDHEECQTCFFRSSLDTWTDMNLSLNFTQFTKEALPLSDSLPHVLHYHNELMDLLVKHIERKDEHSLEPLLDLLVQFARDMGPLFEPHFGRVMSLLINIVAHHNEASVMEWAFNCLAYLLKYLSRLLLPDLRPLYDILSPLLGKEKQKTFITRFAAEALSFLIRKAKDEHLKLIVFYAFSDLRDHHSIQYENGLASTLLESCVSVERALHSRCPSIVKVMLDTVQELGDPCGSCLRVAQKVLTGIIHHTEAETFQEILNVILEFTEDSLSTGNPSLVCGKYIYTVVTVRKGSRVRAWDRVAEQVSRLLDAAHNLGSTGDVSHKAWEIVKAGAVIFQYADVPAVILKGIRIIEQIEQYQDGLFFLPFCELLVELNVERFREFLLTYLQKFIATQWPRYEDGLLLLMPKFIQEGCGDCLIVDYAWLESIAVSLDNFREEVLGLRESTMVMKENSTSDSCVRIWHHCAFLSALQRSVPERVSVALKSLTKVLVEQLSSEQLKVDHIALLGKCLTTLAKLSIELDEAMWSLLYSSIPGAPDIPAFLQGVVDYMKYTAGSLAESFRKTSSEVMERILGNLYTNLRSPETLLRQLSIECFDTIFWAQTGRVSAVTGLMKKISETPFTLASARNISMYVRGLGSQYVPMNKDAWDIKLIPHYLFGLLTIGFAPVWEDATHALAKVAENHEEIVATLAFEWLQTSTAAAEEHAENEVKAKPALSGLECLNLRAVDELSEQCFNNSSDALTNLHIEFGKVCSLLRIELFFTATDVQHFKALRWQKLSVSTARLQALRVLCELPRLAEKRSRILVPLLLAWAAKDDFSEEQEDENDDEDAGHQLTATKWTRKDQLSMLTLFSKFANPRVLYKAEIVYDTFLNLLKSGDTRIQSLALKCILTWNNPAIRTYEVNLYNILDETRFRDEITNFIQPDESESLIQPDHRTQLMPILLRILYGRALSRKSANSGKKGMESRRTVILSALTNFLPAEREMFIDIAIGELVGLRFIDKTDSSAYRFRIQDMNSIYFPVRKQAGFVRMTEDMLKQLGANLLPWAAKILDALLYCLVYSLQEMKCIVEEEASAHIGKVWKPVRQAGFKSLDALFISCPTFFWRPYMQPIFEHIINPKLPVLSAETSQKPSHILQLVSTWSASPYTITFLGDYNPKIIPKVAETIGATTTKDEVAIFALKIINNIVAIVDPKETTNSALSDIVNRDVLQPNLASLLTSTAAMLKRSPGKELLETGIDTVSRLAPFVAGALETTEMVQICVFLLDQPVRRVSPKAKSNILQTLQHFLPYCSMQKGGDLFEMTFRSISSLFGYFRDREGRENLAMVLTVFAATDEALEESSELCVKLNSFSKKRLDEPDFDVRLGAYAYINETAYNKLTARQWTPLIYNMLYYVKDPDFSIRDVSSLSLRRFIETCGKQVSAEHDDYLSLLRSVVLPAIKIGLREQSELIRNQYVLLLGHIVKFCPPLQEVLDMRPLLVGDDEEANFFNNILYVQQHRRARALRRLASTFQKEGLGSSNIAHFLLPLIEHFVLDPDGGDAHHLATEAITAIGVLVDGLTWVQYKALFKRYTSYITSKQEIVKTIVRLVGVVVDSLTRAWSIAQRTRANNFTTASENQDSSMTPVSIDTLAQHLPGREKLADEISKTFLPLLINYLHEKDESTVSLRIPIGVSIVKLLKLFPAENLQIRLPGVLTDMCHILRSRAQESRDMTRKTLAEIALILGPDYFAFILKELRAALLRGYQLHVLSYTVHSILVTVTPHFTPGALDYCVSQVVDIIMDDIFGVAGQEKEAEEYISKMKEVKSSKSFDSMELLAQITTITHLAKLVRPIQALLQEPLTLKLVKKVDELFRRITLGLLKNVAVKTQQLLVFCYEVVQVGYKVAPREKKPEQKGTVPRYLVNLRNPHRNSKDQKTTSQIYKLTKFALDVLKTVLGKHEELMTPENLAGFVPIIGDAILSQQEEVRISALRLLTTILRVPLPAIDEGVPVFIKQCISFIKMCPSTNHELAQASLKLMAAILRERKGVAVNDPAIGYVLMRIKPDLEEPDRQGIAFAFIKAVMARKIVVTELYEVIDEIATILVTNQDKNVRALARGTYFQFLMEYPQGKERLNKQFAFLVKNLEYAYQSGRASVMEVIHLLLTKVGDELIQNIIANFLIPLILTLVNDESTECREMAGALLKKSLERADNERAQLCANLARKWFSQGGEQPLLIRAALQLYTMYIEANKKRAKKEIDFLREKILEFLQCARLTNTTYAKDQTETEWEILYFSLRLWTIIIQTFPEASLSKTDKNVIIWNIIQTCCISYPHLWVRLSSARLMGLYFASWSTSDSLASLPLENEYGLNLDKRDMLNIVRRCAGQLFPPVRLSEELGLQIVKNLLFLGRCFYANKTIMPSKDSLVGSGDMMDIEKKQDEVEEIFSKLESESELENEPSRLTAGNDRVKKISESTQCLTALMHLFRLISRILRQEPPKSLGEEMNSRVVKTTMLHSKKFALQFLTAMVTKVIDKDVETLSTLADTIIYPLYTLLETSDSALQNGSSSSTLQTEDLKEFQELARTVLNHISSTLGPTVYNTAYNNVRTLLTQRRIERKYKRSIAAIADPESVARKKSKKNEKKKVKRKENIEGWKGKRRGL